jgi:aminopeptidase N
MHFQGLDSTCAPSVNSRFVLAGTKRRYERGRPFRLVHQALDVLLLVERGAIEATATLTFERVSRKATHLVLDAVGFEIDSVVFVDGEQERNATFDYDGNELSIAVPSELERGTVAIEYSVVPRRGLYFLAPDEAVPNRPKQVWSQCQDEDARYWFPCHDAPHMKLTSELCVTVPAGWVALSNGTCLSKEPEDDGSMTFHYRIDRPHPSYLVTLVAGEFSILEDRKAKLEDGREIPVRYYVPKGQEPAAWRSLGDTPNMVELFSRLTGLAYPFDEYSQVVVSDFIFGGMENTTATTLYEHVLLDERAVIDVDSRSLVSHELAHQWFGDTLTCRDWSEAWLNEGFATYFEHVERDARLGRDEYDWGVLGDLDAYLGEFAHSYDRPIVCKDYQAPIDLFDRHLYEKGSLVLHMLRRKLGSEIFWSAIRDYVASHENGIVETTQLKRACEKVSGLSLERFFDDWIYRSGHPELSVEAVYEDGRLVVTMKQDPKGSSTTPFGLPFEIEVMTKAGERLTRCIEVTEAQASLTLELSERPTYVAFDPELRVAAPVKLEFGFDWLKNLLLSKATLRARVLAAKALAARTDVPTIELLGQVLADRDQSYLIRLECARSLGKIPMKESRIALLNGTKDERAEVRRAVAQALGQFRNAEVVEPLAELATKDPSYLVQAEACRALGSTRQPGARAVLEACLEVPSWADVVRSGAVDGLATLRDPSLWPLLREHTRYGRPSRGRRSAIAALGRVATDRASRDHLELLLADADPHVRADVVDALSALGQTEALGALSMQLSKETDPRVQRRLREALRDLGAKPEEATKRLSDEVSSLKSKLTELEAKLARLTPPSTTETPEGQASGKSAGKSAASSGRAAPKGAAAVKAPQRRPAAPSPKTARASTRNAKKTLSKPAPKTPAKRGKSTAATPRKAPKTSKPGRSKRR